MILDLCGQSTRIQGWKWENNKNLLQQGKQETMIQTLRVFTPKLPLPAPEAEASGSL